jgi:uncharacterized membrane protein
MDATPTRSPRSVISQAAEPPFPDETDDASRRKLEPRARTPVRETGPLDHNMFAVGHAMARWANGGNLFVGAWLVGSPYTLGYGGTALAFNDIAVGALVILLSALGFRRSRWWVPLANTLLGLWLLLAPIVFWAPTAAGYANDTLAGILLVLFGLLVPMLMPMQGPDVPPGWTYNPSTWIQRAPILALAFTSLLLARHLTAYQLGHIDAVWEPFFGAGSERVLTSEVSRAWPISDAGLGAFVYTVEFLSTLMGDARRWRTMPWMVLMFGLAVVPLGLVSITLVILQPVAVGAWCTLCLATALFMLLMIPLALDEVVAMLQFLAQARRDGLPFWRTFWLGGSWRTAADLDEVRPDGRRPRSWWWGVGLPWNLSAAFLLGIWLLASPALVGTQGTLADNAHLVGAAAATVAAVAWAEVARPARLLLIPLGAWVALAPWVLPGAGALDAVHAMITGTLLVLLALRRGHLRERYGRWDRVAAWRPPRPRTAHA